MPEELVCPQHGPYDAALGACPFCGYSPAAGRPQHPRPLDDDELPTDPFGGKAPRRGGSVDEEAPTGLGRRGGASFPDEEEPTEMPKMRRGRASEDEDELDATVIDRPQTGLLGWLVVKSGGRYGHMYKLKSGAVIGRDSRKADMVLDDEKVSGIHAKFVVKDGRFVLYDLGSANGIHVNGQEITSATPVKENDEIKMGNLVFVLKTMGEASPQP